MLPLREKLFQIVSIFTDNLHMLTIDRDILTRHHAAHQPDPAEKIAHMSGATFRACTRCAAARVKCSGTSHCQRCSDKLLDCRYPPAPKRKRAGKRRPPNKLQDSNGADADAGASDPVIVEDQAATWQRSPAVSNDQYDSNFYPPSNSANGVPLPDVEIARQDAPLANYNVQDALGSQPSHPIPDASWLGNGSYPPPEPYPPNIPYQMSFELAEFGCSTINWLSPTDLGYSQFMFENQYFAVNDFSMPSFEPEIATGYVASLNNQVNQDTSPRNIGQTPNTSHIDATSPRQSDSPGSESTPSKSSAYYVDGAGAREPRYGKLRKHRGIWKASPAKSLIHYRRSDREFSFPEFIEGQIHDNLHAYTVSPLVYERLQDEFKSRCLGTNRFVSEYFPPLVVLQLAGKLYFEYFHPVFPMLHKPSAIESMSDPQNWLLVLAISAIGISYLGTHDATQCSEALLEFLQRSLDSGTDYLNGKARKRLQIQAQVLAVVGMFHSGNQALIEKSYTVRSTMVTTCLRYRMLQEQQSVKTGVRWKEWVEMEAEIRAGYCVWVSTRKNSQIFECLIDLRVAIVANLFSVA
jgi:hypothetical protein